MSLALAFDGLALTNVRGALAVTELARTGAPKRVYLVSSLAVLAASDGAATTLDESTALSATAVIYGAYAQTKWVAEALVRRLVSRAVVLRPGLLTGDSTTSDHAASCPLAAFLRALVTLGCVPETDASRLRVDVTPVDHAARALAEVVTSTDPRAIVHVASAHGASLADLLAAVRAHAPVDVVSPAVFLRAARERLGRDEALALVATSYRLTGVDAQREADLFLHTDRTFRSLSLRAVTGRALPDIDATLLDRYAARACVEARAGAAPRR